MRTTQLLLKKLLRHLQKLVDGLQPRSRHQPKQSLPLQRQLRDRQKRSQPVQQRSS